MVSVVAQKREIRNQNAHTHTQEVVLSSYVLPYSDPLTGISQRRWFRIDKAMVTIVEEKSLCWSSER